MRSRSKGNNNMQAMGCFETDHAQPRSKSPKGMGGTSTAGSGQGAICTYSTVQAASGGARVGAVAGPGLPNDLRVKGGDGHGQLGSVKGPFLGQVYFCTAGGRSQLCRSTPIRSPGSLRLTQNQTQNTQTTPPWEQMGPPWTTALRDQQTRRPIRLQRLQLACRLFFSVFFSLLAACGLLCAAVHGRKREDVSHSGHVTRL